MLNPAIVDIVPFYYPLGNTPAVCLTQDLPCDEPATVLLLGCGDVRNILYTAYSDSVSRELVSSDTAECLVDIKLEPRQLDITCCDIQVAVLGRSTIPLSLINQQYMQHVTSCY